MSMDSAWLQKKWLPPLALLLLGGWTPCAQELQRPDSPRISVQTEIVTDFVTVRDKRGAIVKDLVREDFALAEDGRAQDIRYFSRESDLPLTIGLIVDTTPSEANMLEEERAASRVLLNKMLRPDKDQAFLIQYSHEVELLQDLTSSPAKLEKALGLLERHSFGGGGAGGGTGGPGGGGVYATALADAVYLASDEILKTVPGRKALIILGDGDHVGDRAEMAIAAAQQADTLIYAIRIYDKDFGGGGGGWKDIVRLPPPGGPGGGGPGGGGPGGDPGGGPGGGSPGGGPGGGPPGGGDRSAWKKNLQALSGKTGGEYFEVGKKMPLEEIYRRIEEELRSQYSLGYAPGADARKGYRQISVSVGKKDLVVHGREGYYPKE